MLLKGHGFAKAARGDDRNDLKSGCTCETLNTRVLKTNPEVGSLRGGLGGAVSVIAIAILQHYVKVTIDPTLASAITIVVSFVVSYIVPPSARDAPVPA